MDNVNSPEPVTKRARIKGERQIMTLKNIEGTSLWYDLKTAQTFDESRLEFARPAPCGCKTIETDATKNS